MLNFVSSASVIQIEDETVRNVAKNTPKVLVETSRNAFKSGRTKCLKFRQKQLKGLLRFLEDRREQIEDAIYKDLRKHREETNICEIELVANDLRHTIYELKNWAKPHKPQTRLIHILDGVYVYNDPYGVVLIIGSWNYPVLLTLGPLVGALAAGNTIILKPSELSPTTSKLLQRELPKFLDPECFQIFLGGIEDTTELLKEKFDYIFFTGSTETGKIIQKAAAKFLTPTTLELGGKCPVFLDETADLHKATRRILWGRLLNSGQTCVAPDYLLCSKEMEEKFILEAKKILDEFYGENHIKSNSLSRIVTEKHFKRLLDFLQSGNIALGGNFDLQNRLISPTILTNVKPDDRVMKEEIFGPILPILTVKSPEQAVEFITTREKPLALYVFSKRKKIQEMFLKNTSPGGVCINDCVTQIGTEGLPFGGVGGSGMGSYHGRNGFETFSHQKGVLVKDFSSFTEFSMSLRYPPYSEKKTKLMNFILKKRRGISLEVLKEMFWFFLGICFVLLLEYFGVL